MIKAAGCAITASCALNTEDSRMILLAIHEARGKTEEAQFICIWQQKMENLRRGR